MSPLDLRAAPRRLSPGWYLDVAPRLLGGIGTRRLGIVAVTGGLAVSSACDQRPQPDTGPLALGDDGVEVLEALASPGCTARDSVPTARSAPVVVSFFGPTYDVRGKRNGVSATFPVAHGVLLLGGIDTSGSEAGDAWVFDAGLFEEGRQLLASHSTSTPTCPWIRLSRALTGTGWRDGIWTGQEFVFYREPVNGAGGREGVVDAAAFLHGDVSAPDGPAVPATGVVNFLVSETRDVTCPTTLSAVWQLRRVSSLSGVSCIPNDGNLNGVFNEDDDMAFLNTGCETRPTVITCQDGDLFGSADFSPSFSAIGADFDDDGNVWWLNGCQADLMCKEGEAQRLDCVGRYGGSGITCANRKASRVGDVALDVLDVQGDGPVDTSGPGTRDDTGNLIDEGAGHGSDRFFGAEITAGRSGASVLPDLGTGQLVVFGGELICPDKSPDQCIKASGLPKTLVDEMQTTHATRTPRAIDGFRVGPTGSAPLGSPVDDGMGHYFGQRGVSFGAQFDGGANHWTQSTGVKNRFLLLAPAWERREDFWSYESTPPSHTDVGAPTLFAPIPTSEDCDETCVSACFANFYGPASVGACEFADLGGLLDVQSEVHHHWLYEDDARTVRLHHAGECSGMASAQDCVVHQVGLSEGLVVEDVATRFRVAPGTGAISIGTRRALLVAASARMRDGSGFLGAMNGIIEFDDRGRSRAVCGGDGPSCPKSTGGSSFDPTFASIGYDPYTNHAYVFGYALESGPSGASTPIIGVIKVTEARAFEAADYAVTSKVELAEVSSSAGGAGAQMLLRPRSVEGAVSFAVRCDGHAQDGLGELLKGARCPGGTVPLRLAYLERPAAAPPASDVDAMFTVSSDRALAGALQGSFSFVASDPGVVAATIAGDVRDGDRITISWLGFSDLANPPAIVAQKESGELLGDSWFSTASTAGLPRLLHVWRDYVPYAGVVPAVRHHYFEAPLAVWPALPWLEAGTTAPNLGVLGPEDAGQVYPGVVHEEDEFDVTAEFTVPTGYVGVGIDNAPLTSRASVTMHSGAPPQALTAVVSKNLKRMPSASLAGGVAGRGDLAVFADTELETFVTSAVPVLGSTWNDARQFHAALATTRPPGRQDVAVFVVPTAAGGSPIASTAASRIATFPAEIVSGAISPIVDTTWFAATLAHEVVHVVTWNVGLPHSMDEGLASLIGREVVWSQTATIDRYRKDGFESIAADQSQGIQNLVAGSTSADLECGLYRQVPGLGDTLSYEAAEFALHEALVTRAASRNIALGSGGIVTDFAGLWRDPSSGADVVPTTADLFGFFDYTMSDGTLTNLYTQYDHLVDSASKPTCVGVPKYEVAHVTPNPAAGTADIMLTVTTAADVPIVGAVAIPCSAEWSPDGFACVGPSRSGPAFVVEGDRELGLQGLSDVLGMSEVRLVWGPQIGIGWSGMQSDAFASQTKLMVCSSTTTCGTDADRDGFPDVSDCVPSDPAIFPGSAQSYLTTDPWAAYFDVLDGDCNCVLECASGGTGTLPQCGVSTAPPSWCL